MTNEQFYEITKWQKETFPAATTNSKLSHLSDELKELKEAIKAGNSDMRLEFADCFLLLFGAAASEGLSYLDIVCAIDEKMVINRRRSWGKPDERGVVNHIK